MKEEIAHFAAPLATTSRTPINSGDVVQPAIPPEEDASAAGACRQ